ncbi:MAG TPA: hypothetical protein VIV34_11515 [Pseudolabrys sp.]
MFIPILATAVTLLGAAGLVVSSLVHASWAGDFVFNFAAVCLVAGPLLFFVYVIIGLCIEFVQTSQNPEGRTVARGSLRKVSAEPLVRAAYYDALPEGLRRERMGPLNPSTGRARAI